MAGMLKEEAQRADPRRVELFQLTAARVRELLAKDGPGLDQALKADPVAGAVEYGTNAVRTVVNAATKAGHALPFDVVVNVGVQTIKDLGDIANRKGYLPDEQIEPFLKEAFQQSLARYSQADQEEGLVSPEQLQQVRQRLQGMQQPGAPEEAMA